jgi:hypothetical protein
MTLFIWPEFSKHLKKKFNWSTETFESINWVAFRHQANKQTVNRQTSLLKFVYEWLPIGKILQHIDPSAETKCPSCNMPIETPQHMFCCPKEERKGITQLCIKQVIDLYTKWKTREDLKISLEMSLNFWIAHPLTQPPSAQIVNPEVRTAIKGQSKVGWGNFFKGFITTKLQHLINEQRDGPLNQFEQIWWTCNIIDIVWESQNKHWTHRNRDKHGNTPGEEGKIKRDALLKQAHELYQLKSQIDPKYRT